MDEFNANFIPLGSGSGLAPRPVSSRLKSLSGRPERVIGETKEERKRIAREIRLAAKKAHKKEKADAKRARKLNGILHRRMTKNPEKYIKNKDRNRQRAIDLERRKIQYGAVHQCERLAAKHDPSGRMFNVGEVIITAEGQVKSKEALQRDAEREAQQKAEKEAEALQPRNRKISKNQIKRQEMLKPKPVPPKPVIPDGITLPEGEENLVELFDITDQQIESRLKRQKSAKKQAAKDLRKIQKEKKKLNRAMKLRKKQCAYAGVTWDPERARKEIIGEMTKEAEDDSGSDSDSDSSDDESDAEGETNGDASKESQRRTSSSEDLEPVVGMKKKKKLPEIQRPKLDLELIAKAEEIERQRQQKKLIARQRRREERKRKAEEEERKAEAARAVEEAEKANAVECIEEKSEKKRKRSRDDDEETEGVSKKDKSHKKKKAKTEEVENKSEDVKSADDEPAKKKKKKSKTNFVDLTVIEEDEPTKKKKKSKSVDVGAAVVTEDEPETKKKKEKRDRTEETELTEAELEKKARKEKRRKQKHEESNDDKLDRQIAERRAGMKAEIEQSEEAARNGAEHWNPDALSGDSARKEKFLRLLGANKSGKTKEEKSKDKNSTEEITKVQTELERQYEAGMKMKHDGGSKRRGLGA